MINKGIGYIEYRKKRINEGLMSSKIESAGNERFVVYFGRVHLNDHETDQFCRGYLKIGRGKFATALMRGRNQPGIDFRIYAEIVVDNNDDTRRVEQIAQGLLISRNVKFSQGQKEMYNIKDDELMDIVHQVADRAKTFGIDIKMIEKYI